MSNEKQAGPLISTKLVKLEKTEAKFAESSQAKDQTMHVLVEQLQHAIDQQTKQGNRKGINMNHANNVHPEIRPN